MTGSARRHSARPSGSPADDCAAAWEALAFFLGHDASGTEVMEGLVRRFECVGDALSADRADLRRLGVGDDEMARLARLQDLCASLARSRASRRSALTSSSDLIAYLRIALAHLPREQFRALYLDKRNFLISDEFVADGSVDHAPVYPREVIRRALELSASALILVHNHPSGDPTPSSADIVMTRKIADAAKVFDIQVHDHLVVARQGTASLRQLGLFR